MKGNISEKVCAFLLLTLVPVCRERFDREKTLRKGVKVEGYVVLWRTERTFCMRSLSEKCI